MIVESIKKFAATDWITEVLTGSRHPAQMQARRDQIIAAIRDEFTQTEIEAVTSLFSMASNEDVQHETEAE